MECAGPVKVIDPFWQGSAEIVTFSVPFVGSESLEGEKLTPFRLLFADQLTYPGCPPSPRVTVQVRLSMLPLQLALVELKLVGVTVRYVIGGGPQFTETGIGGVGPLEKVMAPLPEQFGGNPIYTCADCPAERLPFEGEIPTP